MDAGPKAPGRAKPRQSFLLLGVLASSLVFLIWFLSASVERDAGASVPPSSTSAPAPTDVRLPDVRLPDSEPSNVLVQPNATETAKQADSEIAAPPAVAPPTYEPWKEPPPPLRGVTGLVRDAATHVPIRGAWLAWRLPPPSISEKVLSNTGPRDPAFRMLTGPSGRFRVDRLPDDASISSTLFVVAKGYAYGALTVGLARDVVFDLVPMGSLEVEISGAVEDANPGGVLEIQPKNGPPDPIEIRAEGERSVRVPHLPAGPCTVTLDRQLGGASVTVTVTPGQVTQVKLTRPTTLSLTGTLTSQSRGLAARLEFMETTRLSWHTVNTDEFGRFELDVPRGRYVAHWFETKTLSLWRVGAVLEAGAQGVQLAWDPSRLVDVELRLKRQGRDKDASLTLFSLDEHLGTIVELIAQDGDSARVFRAKAVPGPYVLLEGVKIGGVQEVLQWGEFKAPGVHSSVLNIRSTPLTWGGLEGLEDSEIVRGEFRLLPMAAASRPWLNSMITLSTKARTFRASRRGAPLNLLSGAPGRFALIGKSDLGPFRVELDLPSNGVRVDLSAAQSSRPLGD